MKNIITLFTFSTCFNCALNAQITIQNNVLATSGQSLSGGGIVMDYTLGETVTASLPLGSQNNFTQGFQQPDVKSASSLAEFNTIDFGVSPNPFDNEVSIKIPIDKVMGCAIYDNAGRLIRTVELTNVVTKLNLNELSSGNYQLILQEGELLIGRASLIKSH